MLGKPKFQTFLPIENEIVNIFLNFLIIMVQLFLYACSSIDKL